jgi:hypothetical protein
VNQSALNIVIMNRQMKATYRLMPEFIERIKAFEDNDWTSSLAGAFEEAFCQGSFVMLGIALMDDDGIMRGHCVAGIETFAGKSQAFIYQLAKDQGNDGNWRETTSTVQSAVEAWAHMAGARLGTEITHVMVSLMDEKRERLFGRFGYEKGPRLMRKGL